MVSAVHGGHSYCIKASHLAKIWCIDENIVKRTLEVKTQWSIGATILNSRIAMEQTTRFLDINT